MPTEFDQASYPLSDKTTMTSDFVVARDRLDDGTGRIRVLGTSTFRIINCVFENLTEAQSIALENYLIANLATEFTMVVSGLSGSNTYQGYLWSDPYQSVRDGAWYTVKVDFRGEVV